MALLDLTIHDEFGSSFATRERATEIVGSLGLYPYQVVLIRFGLGSFCAPGFIQGLLASLGPARPIFVEASSCPVHTRSIVNKVSTAFGMTVEFL